MIESRTQLEQGFSPGFAPVNQAGRSGVSIPATYRMDPSGRIRLDDLPSVHFAEESKWFPTNTYNGDTTEQITLNIPQSHFWRTLWLGFPSVTLDANVFAFCYGSILGFLGGQKVYEQPIRYDTAGGVNTYTPVPVIVRSGVSPCFQLSGSVTGYPSPGAVSAYQLSDEMGQDDLAYCFNAVIPTTPNMLFVGQAIMKPFRFCAALDRLVLQTTSVQLSALAAAGLIFACRSQNTPH